MDVVEFLRERLDEDEAEAIMAQRIREGRPEEWKATPARYGTSEVHTAAGKVVALEVPDGARHIARHDPARVLCEVEAKRRIIELHDKWPVLVERPMSIEQVPSAGINDITFRASQQIAWLTAREYVKRFGTQPPAAPMFAALASIYADHPDYDPDWR